MLEVRSAGAAATPIDSFVLELLEPAAFVDEGRGIVAGNKSANVSQQCFGMPLGDPRRRRRHVRRDDDVGHFPQRMIGRQRLDLEHVQPRAGDLTGFECRGQVEPLQSAVCTTRSRTVGTPSGRCSFEPGLGIHTRLTSCGRYLFSRSVCVNRLRLGASRLAKSSIVAYCQIQAGERLPEEDLHLSNQTHSQAH